MNLKANTNLAAEIFDGEVVLIDIQRAVYFSLRGAASVIWQAFAEPRSRSTVLDTMTKRLKGANRAELQATLERMEQEQLLLPSETCADTDFELATIAYVAPQVESFSDLADLIAIDPVHEVDAGAGWPVKPSHFPDVD